MKKKSPKVYKVKTGNTKSSSVHNVLSAVVMIAAAGLICWLQHRKAIHSG